MVGGKSQGDEANDRGKIVINTSELKSIVALAGAME